MPESTLGAEPLLQAIAELRGDIDRWVEEGLRVLEEGSGFGGERAARLGAKTSYPLTPTPPLHGAEPEPKGRYALPPTPPYQGGEPEGASPGASGHPQDDPRRRLDALAQHLDRRLKRSRDPDRP
jgi:hypothetical protein